MEQYLQQITGNVGLLHALVGFLIPLILCGMLTRFLRRKALFPQRLESLEIGQFCRHCLHRAYYLVARFLGPEFPSMVGGFIGLMLVVPAAKRGWFVPEETFDFPPKDRWESRWLGTLSGETHDDDNTPTFSVFRAFSPYVIVIGLLILTRALKTLKAFLTGDMTTITLPNLFGSAITSKVQFGYSPAPF